MTKQERLTLYKAALKDYRKKNSRNTSYGFCNYFISTYSLVVYEISDTFKIFPKVLPELFEQKPKRVTNTQQEWWSNGVKAPRIKALKAAIKIIEDGN